MALYKQPRSKIWWYGFQFNGQRIQESSKTASKVLAGEAMRARRRQMEERFNSVKKRELPKLFSAAAEEYLAVQRSRVTPGSVGFAERAIRHLMPFFQRMLLVDITPPDIKKFIDAKLAAGITPAE